MAIDLNYIRRDYDINMSPEFVQRLNNNDFSDNGMLRTKPLDKNIVIVFFFTPECRFCQEFAPELAEFSKQFGKQLGVITAAVDVSLQENEQLKERSKHFKYCIGEFYPTTIIYRDGSPCTTYLSFRTADEIKKYISEKIINKSCPSHFIGCTNPSVEKLERLYTQMKGSIYNDTSNSCSGSNYSSSQLSYWNILLLLLLFTILGLTLSFLADSRKKRRAM